MDEDLKFAIEMLTENDWECTEHQTPKGKSVKGCTALDGGTKLKIRELKTGLSLLID